jgi:hypothetical protein
VDQRIHILTRAAQTHAHPHCPGHVSTPTGSDLAPSEARVGGSPLIGGALRDWAEAEGIRFSPAPGTLAAALPFALDCCRRYIRESWRQWGFEKLTDFHLNEPGGYCPPSAPPFCVAILTSTELQTLEVSE